MPAGALHAPDFGCSGSMHSYVFVFFGMQAMYMLYDLPAVALRANAFSRCSKMRCTVCLVCRVFDYYCGTR